MQRKYFLGGVSASGFQTRFGEVMGAPGMFTYILKGGPGTGKSTLMKKIDRHFSEYDRDIYYCSSDTRSIDAVVIEAPGIAVVDGTAPHIFNAQLPGVAQSLVDLGTCWDKNKIAERAEDIRRCFAENARYHRRARANITALSAVNHGISEHFSQSVDYDKINKYAAELLSSLPAANGSGGCTYRQLSAMTADGYSTHQPPAGYQTRTFGDERYAAGFALMDALRLGLLAGGYDIMVSECVLFPENKTEHIWVPSCQMHFAAGTGLNKLSFDSGTDCGGLYLSPLGTGENEELARQQKIALSLEAEAAYSIRRALDIHDELESCYISALDFGALDLLTERLIDEIKARTA